MFSVEGILALSASGREIGFGLDPATLQRFGITHANEPRVDAAVVPSVDPRPLAVPAADWVIAERVAEPRPAVRLSQESTAAGIPDAAAVPDAPKGTAGSDWFERATAGVSSPAAASGEALPYGDDIRRIRDLVAEIAGGHAQVPLMFQYRQAGDLVENPVITERPSDPARRVSAAYKAT